MRTPTLLAAVLLLAAAPAAGSAEPPAPAAASSPGPVETTQDANRDGLAGAAKAPLRDLNLIRTKIPPVLQEALADPYARPARLRCGDILAALAPLNEALGVDLDEPSEPNDGHLIDKGREAAAGAALDAVAGAAQDLIPFRGWVRRLTGAERHDRLVRASITAGGVRRGYLKGLGEAKGCKPPAAPRPSAAKIDDDPTPPPAVDRPGKPRYPTH